jgi:hypothetical protein
LGDASFEAVAEAVAASPAGRLLDRCGASLARDDRVADLLVCEGGVASACGEAAVCVHAVHVRPGLSCFCDRAVEQAAVADRAAVGDADDHEALGGVGDAGLVAELVRPGRAAHPDRSRVGIDERDAPVGDRALSRQPQIGLREHPLGRIQLRSSRSTRTALLRLRRAFLRSPAPACRPNGDDRAADREARDRQP